MPVDEGSGGRLPRRRRRTAAERLDERRLERARKRAGVPAPAGIRDSRTVSNVERERRTPPPYPTAPAPPSALAETFRRVGRPVRGEDAREKAELAERQRTPGVGDSGRDKARLPRQQAARERYETVLHQPVLPTAASRADYRRKQRDLHGSLAALTPGELRDFSSYTRARSEQLQRENDPQEQIFAALTFSPELAKLLPGGTPASEASRGWAAFEAVTLAPGALIGKPLGGAVRGGRAIRKARRGDGPAGRVLDAPEARTVRWNELETQFPNSPSLGTRYAQRLWDKASVALGKGATRLRDSDSVVARAAGAAITPVSARARVPKQAGKLTKKEASRRQAARAQALRDVRDVGRVFPGFKREPVRVAAFWFAQLPRAYRNQEGLELVRARLTENLADYTSGAFSERVDSALRGLRAELAGLRRGERVQPVAPDGPLEVGDYVRAADRDNYGRIEAIDGDSARVHFVNTAERTRATVDLPLAQLTGTGYRAAAGGATVDPTDLYRLQADIEELRAIQADIPDRIKDLTVDLRKLDTTIARLPRLKVDERPIEAMRELMRDRQDILVRAGKLDPDTAADREGLVSRWLGLEPDGSEVYIGHRLDRVRGSRSSGLPGGMSLGKTRLPEGVAAENTLQLLMTGRARKDLMSVIEDWQAAQVYDFHNLAKDDLAKMGEPITGRPKPGYVVVNPRGHLLPRTWKVDDAGRAAAEGFDNEDVLVRDVGEYIDNYFAEADNAAAWEAMKEKAIQAGHYDDLRQLPTDVARRYFSQLVPTRILAATPGVKEGAGAVGKTADWVNDLVYMSLIYSNPGYVPAAFAANLALTAAQQGAFLPANLARAGQLLIGGPPQLRDLVRNEVGAGMASAVASGTQLAKVASAVSAVGDEPWRVASFMHEAARVGVIPKAKPVLTDADYAALEEFLTDPRYRDVLNDVSDRATQAVLDFNRLGSMERAVAKRILFVWGFLRAAARHPGRFALDHPVRSGAAAAAAYAYQDELRDLDMEDMPSWMHGTIETGSKVVDGSRYPTGLRTESYDPIRPLLNLANTATGDPDARTFFETLHPAIQAVARGLNRERASGFEAGSYREALTDNAQRLVPWVDRAGNYLRPPSPEETGIFPEDATRLGRLKRDLRVIPVAIDAEEAAQVRQRELSRRGQAKIEAVKERHEKLLAKAREDAKTLGLAAPTPEVLEAIRLKAAVEGYIDALDAQERKRDDRQTPSGEQFKLTARQKAAAALLALQDALPPDRFDYAHGKSELDGRKGQEEAEAFLDALRRDAYNNVLSDWTRQVNAARP